MKRYLLLVYFILFCGLLSAQQYTSVTLFEWNRIVFNPAFSGTSSTTDITVLTRQQWVGFTDAPKNQYVSAHAYLGGDVGVGGVVFNNVTGPTRRTGMKGAFSKHIKLRPDLMLSLGLSLDIYQNFYDGTQLKTGIPGDPAIVESTLKQQLAPDASFGALLYSEYFFVGLSSTNLTQSRYDFLSTKSQFNNPVSRSYFLTGSYTYYFNKDFHYSPGVLVEKTIGLPFKVDFMNRFVYKNIIGGLSFRSSLDASAFFGMQIANNYEFAYSFDYSFHPLGTYSNGSHEILLRIKFKNYYRNVRRGPGGKSEIPWS